MGNGNQISWSGKLKGAPKIGPWCTKWYFYLIMNQICSQCGKATKAIEELGESLIMKPLCWKQENVWRPTKKCTNVRKDNRNH